MSKPRWDFGYVPVSAWPADDDGRGGDLVVALSSSTTKHELLRALQGLVPDARVRSLFSYAPIFWWRVRSDRALRRADLADCLSGAKLEPRYVASALRPGLAVPPALRSVEKTAVIGEGWKVRKGSLVSDPDSPGRWFLRRETGVAINRVHFGTGGGTRLAVLDDDAAGLAELDLDAEVLVNLDAAPRSSLHGATMIALAVGTREERHSEQRWQSFRGVAPHASPRLYCMPKPGQDVISVPLAIAQATADGADVIVCATQIEAMVSPMLDDALEFATRYGRKGRGAAVVVPVGRQTSSPANSVHASLSLALEDPASDPRVFAIGPSGKEGGWFFWKDRKGRLRPFANRGPSVRWLAPGDDLSFPFAHEEKLGHAESSGASAIAAGVILLVLATNSRLRLAEIDAILTRTATPVVPDVVPSGVLVDSCEVDPLDRDKDGHNAKHGYGRLHAERACLSAVDPVCAALVAIGEDQAALRYLEERRKKARLRASYSPTFARWLVRAFLTDMTLFHSAKVLARHVRLMAPDPRRRDAHCAGALVRQLILFLRSARQSRAASGASKRVLLELAKLLRQLNSVAVGASWEAACYELMAPLWDAGPPGGRVIAGGGS